jgi:hypothetical protein
LPSPSRSIRSSLQISTDFDNTLIAENLAQVMVSHYLRHGHEHLGKRILLVLPIMTTRLRRKNLDRFYDILRRIPSKERQAIIARIDPNPQWLDAVQRLKFKHNARAVEINIISRNCIDLVRVWVLQNHEQLRQKGITVKSITANRSLRDTKNEFVRRTAARQTHAGTGVLNAARKGKLLGKGSIYIGDFEETMLKDAVKEFIQV